ncbi:MAG: hypothetical protein ACRAUW_14995 [Aeromonas sp.]|uniref:hypothetical protein n=1 Tax=Aeromonas sp. TaxID=647 RepID=UPI003D6BDE1D
MGTVRIRWRLRQGQRAQTYQMTKALHYKLMTDLTKRSEKKHSEEEFKKIMSL